MRRADLTEAQTKVLNAIQQRREAGEPPPTYRELASECGWTSTATVRDHLAALERKGYLARGGHRARGIRLETPPPKVDTIPVLGHVVAGIPEEASEFFEGNVSVPLGMTGGKPSFALHVHGDSMIDAGILDGDVAVIRRQSTAEHGDTVAATVQGETTLKRYEQRGKSAWLVPANKRYRPIRLISDGVVIHGVMVGLLRGRKRLLEVASLRSRGHE